MRTEEMPRIGFVGILIEDRHKSAGEVNAILSEFGDVEEVGDQLAHHLSGIVLVIVGEG